MRSLFTISVFVLISFVAQAQSNREKESIVILNLKALSVEKGLADTVTESLITSFVSMGKYRVIERAQLDKIFGELKMSAADEFTDSMALEIGQMAKSKIVVIGSVGRAGSSYLITIRTISVESGEVLYADKTIAKSQEELLFGTDIIANKILQKDYEELDKQKNAQFYEEQRKAEEEKIKQDQEAAEKMRAAREAEEKRQRIAQEEEKQRILEEEAEKQRIAEEKALLRKRKPLKNGGIALVTLGSISLLSGIAFTIVDFAVVEPLSRTSIAHQLPYSNYVAYKQMFTGFFIAGVVQMSIGALMVGGGIPMILYINKDVSAEIKLGTTPEFALRISF